MENKVGRAEKKIWISKLIKKHFLAFLIHQGSNASKKTNVFKTIFPIRSKFFRLGPKTEKIKSLTLEKHEFEKQNGSNTNNFDIVEYKWFRCKNGIGSFLNKILQKIEIFDSKTWKTSLFLRNYQSLKKRSVNMFSTFGILGLSGFRRSQSLSHPIFFYQKNF